MGLSSSDPNDGQLIVHLERVLQSTETDMTIFFRLLSNIPKAALNQPSAIDYIRDAFYDQGQVTQSVVHEWEQWLAKYQTRLHQESDSDDNKSPAS